jgi:hypothetical protein
MEEQATEWKPRGGRPKLASQERRDQVYNIRLTEGERKELHRLAAEAGYSDVSVYARKRLLASGDAVSFNPKPLFRAIDKTGAELKRIGNNINQLTKYVHYLEKNHIAEGKVMEEYNRHFEEFIQVEDAYVRAIRAFLRITR